MNKILEYASSLNRAPLGRVLLLGFELDDASLPEGLAQEATILPGLEALRKDPLLASSGTREALFDGIVVAPPRLDRDYLSKLRRLLTERGRLFLALSATQMPVVVARLSELGFSIDREDPSADERIVLVARKDPFVVLPYREGHIPADEQAILELFGPSFHTQRSLEHWRWKFEQHPLRRPPLGQYWISLAWSPEGELAAHYAAYPVIWARYSRSGAGAVERWVSMQIGDTMTNPRFRSVGRGAKSLLGRTLRHFFARHCDGRVDFNFGVNTGKIQRYNLRFVQNAERLEPLGYWTRSASREIPSPGKSYSVELIDLELLRRRPGRFTRFLARVGRCYGTLVERDDAWIRWRYLSCPDEPRFIVLAARKWGRWVGWSVFRRKGARLMWCDALFLPGHVDASRTLLRRALQMEENQDVESVEVWSSPRPAFWISALESMGFGAKPEPDDLALIFAPFLLQGTREALTDSFYMLGDCDLA